MFELSGVNYEEVLEQGDSILVRVIASSSYRGFELSGLYCICKNSNASFLSSYITRYKTRVRILTNYEGNNEVDISYRKKCSIYN